MALGFLSACARPSVTSQAEPEAAPEDSSAYVISGDEIQGSSREMSEIIELALQGRVSEIRQSNNMQSSGEVEKRPHESIANLLQGRASGVHVSTNPDGSISVRIRGASSFMSSSEPLYVLDGTPIEAGPNGALVGVNPYDIESIEVLKYPPATSMYGVRGANGVIVIKTKRARQ
jgi:TonB-dependent SusC/RagA subfamily outer membrane receptor